MVGSLWRLDGMELRSRTWGTEPWDVIAVDRPDRLGRLVRVATVEIEDILHGVERRLPLFAIDGLVKTSKDEEQPLGRTVEGSLERHEPRVVEALAFVDDDSIGAKIACRQRFEKELAGRSRPPKCGYVSSCREGSVR